MYIGNQEIISETPADNGLIEVKLKADPLDNMGEVETAFFHNEILESVKTEEPLVDLTELRHRRCAPIISVLLMVCIEYNIQVQDFKHIIMMLEDNIMNAKHKHERKLYGDHELKRTLHHFRKEMMANNS